MNIPIYGGVATKSTGWFLWFHCRGGVSLRPLVKQITGGPTPPLKGCDGFYNYSQKNIYMFNLKTLDF